MSTIVQHMKECSLVLMKGHIEEPDCAFLENVLLAASLSRNKSIWVDCENVTSVSFKALRKLLSLSNEATSEGVNLLFFEMTPSVKKAIKVSRMEAVLHVVPSIADASRYCRNKRKG
ncbi:STAS domain-containing protein [Pontibacter diazotrophicus]|uniref:STAS domain-containing protein n=1 Tax=Pontibacter diazotrophicus TaxID=1400979 RepID=A0A3D8L6F2_9BACT|nr:STAS domain-containing protein [Pontibacter diazotrophicus]RDV12981.1 STAS domain-containing protein [Pontibacter diazotrophicus]